MLLSLLSSLLQSLSSFALSAVLSGPLSLTQLELSARAK